MGKAALLALGVLVVTEAYTQRGQIGFSSASASRVSSEQGEALARSAAITGFEKARHLLTTQNFASATISGTQSGASFSGAASISGSLGSAVGDVQITGSYQNANGSVSKYRASGKLVQSTEDALEAPAYMQFG